MIRRPPRSTPLYSSAASDVYKRQLYAGIWEATPGKWRIVYDEWEFCHILSGVSVISEDGGEARTVKAGDSFVLRPGFQGSWEVIETTRKEYVIKL